MKKTIILVIISMLFVAGCQPGKHEGHVYFLDPDHIKVTFDRPMSMSVERDGVKVEASSLKPGFFEQMLQFMLLRPR